MKTDPNCISYWFPLLCKSNVPVPITEIVRVDGAALIGLLDPSPLSIQQKKSVVLIAEAAERIGFPCFLRSGYYSGKHSWKKTCWIPDVKSVLQHVAAIIENGECENIFGFDWGVWAARELLPCPPTFTAPRFDDMPVNQERRYFIEGGKVIGHLPYWCEEAVQQGCCGWTEDGDHAPLSEELAKALAELNRETEEEVEELSRLSTQVSRHLDGAWSLDWLMTERGWYAIDMATAKTSWGWDMIGAAKGAMK